MTGRHGVSDKESLKQIVLDGNCVVFIGAGLSIPPGAIWRESVEKIASRCGVDMGAKPWPEIIDTCQDTFPKEYGEVFQELFPKHTATLRTALSHALRLPFKAYVTTNFDPWLSGAARSEDIVCFHMYPDIPLSEGLSKRIYYLHGLYDLDVPASGHESVVFGKRSFDAAYGVESLLPGFLLNLFVYEHVLFMGFNPSEDNIRKIVQRADAVQADIGKYRKSPDMPRKFILWPNRDYNRSQAEHDAETGKIQALGITPIMYDPNPTTIYRMQPSTQPASVSDERDRPDGSSYVSMRQGQ